LEHFKRALKQVDQTLLPDIGDNFKKSKGETTKNIHKQVDVTIKFMD